MPSTSACQHMHKTSTTKLPKERGRSRIPNLSCRKHHQSALTKPQPKGTYNANVFPLALYHILWQATFCVNRFFRKILKTSARLSPQINIPHSHQRCPPNTQIHKLYTQDKPVKYFIFYLPSNTPTFHRFCGKFSVIHQYFPQNLCVNRRS